MQRITDKGTPMILTITRPLCTFDLETTGVDVLRDRIVDVSVVRRTSTASGAPEETVLSSLINPGRQIPADATAVHHISDADVAQAPTFEAFAPKLFAFMAGSDLSGFNVQAFDIPLLAAEFKRAGFEWPAPGTRVIDTHLIFKRLLPHSLSAAVELFCSRPHADAHRAEADALAASDVLDGQLAFFADKLPRSADELAAWCATKEPGFVDCDGKLRWQGGEATFSFGKMLGLTLRSVARDDPGFLRWVMTKDFSAEVKGLCADALKGRFPVQEPTQDAAVAPQAPPAVPFAWHQGDRCCPRATKVHCVCIASWSCPVHGSHCFGSHD